MTEPAPGEQPPQVFQLEVPDALQGGVYSNVVSVWHTAYEFTLDFAVLQPAQLMTNDQTGEQAMVVPGRAVARVKIPPPVLLELLTALSQNERRYEENVGPILRPGRPEDDPPLYPPDS